MNQDEYPVPTEITQFTENLKTQMKSSGVDDPEFLCELLETYLQSAPELLEQAFLALDKGNLLDAERAIHSLKSSSRLMGAHDLGTLCEQLERHIHAGPYDQVPGELKQVDGTYKELIPILEGTLHALRSQQVC